MNKSVLFIFLSIVIFLEGCVLSPPANSRKSLLNNNLNGTNLNPTGAPVQPTTFAADEINPYWFDNQKIVGTMTINSNTQNIYYLRGKSIHTFLSSASSATTFNYQNTFCIKADFATPTLYNNLWVRAIPLAISNFTTQSVERVLRVDIPNAADNYASCAQTGTAAYSPSQTPSGFPSFKLCTPASICSGKITTLNMSLFLAKTNTAGVVAVPLTSVDINSAKLQIDLQSNASSTASLCSNSSCNAKGFDCCIEGQCVKDATEKSSAKNNMTEYNQAMSEYRNNPLSFINWPNVFYICSNIAHAPPPITPPSTTTPLSDAQTRVKTYLGDYQCVSDVQASLGYARCQTTTNATAYNSIKLKLARSCGCTAIDAEVALKCPDWGVRPLYSTSIQTDANIVDFYCYTPQPPSQFGPITNLDVAVPNRAAPHRLYTEDGAAYNLITDMPKVTPAPVQEGTLFSYIDELNKMSPENGSYNINSILGSMSVDLNHTLPAKIVNVELGKSYLLTAKSGFYTPCPKCAKDVWYQSFFPFAPSRNGTGLQASGYTTSRDTYSDNTTLGNYEDTKFGRACFVPVTMLPFAHNKENSLQLQRKHRLSTQAAYYINGYQRDWFGFNQGALIGSFDGVTWFAIGNGRRITATTTKLFLAINAAFLDLADKTDTVVNIVPDSINNVVADYDYDTTLPLNSSRQNQGGTCQKFHQCNNDTDCITQLGWEYVCADVSQYKTKWPVSNTDGDEQFNKESNATLFEILASTTDTRNTLRCVYRGAGAPCKGDATKTTSLNSLNQKLFTCAPNFYCAPINGNYFNNELVRSPNEPNNFMYGLDANVLGRPLNYVAGNETLPDEVITNIKANAANIIKTTTTNIADMGMCRPGKSLDHTKTLAIRHSLSDIQKRTDFVSQIANCDSKTPLIAPATIDGRYVNCPVIDMDSTSVTAVTTYLNYITAPTSTEIKLQNSCGAESKYTPVGGTSESAFKYIEFDRLDRLVGISSPGIPKDACLRRAGSICHSDLDCGPNLLHEQAAATLPKSAFGGTEAEQAYWSESLICGQAAPKPLINTEAYGTYQLNQNRCCRDIGKDFTMYTQGHDTTNNTGLSTSRFSYNDPSAAGRYSRYSVSATAKKTTNVDTTNTVTGTGEDAIPKIDTAVSGEPAKYQWKVIGETGKNTCCGGGFIRKFADGTHDWYKTGRLNIDTSNFTCLNYRSPLVEDPLKNIFSDTRIRQASYENEYNLFCSSTNADPFKVGCLQIPYATSSSATEFSIILPSKYTEEIAQTPFLGTLVGAATAGDAGGGSGVLSMAPNTYPLANPWTVDKNVNAPYYPTPVGSYPVGNNTPPDYVTSEVVQDERGNFGFAFYLPTYIQNSYTGGVHDAIKRVIIHYVDDAGNKITMNPGPIPLANTTAVLEPALGVDPAAPVTPSTNVPMKTYNPLLPNDNCQVELAETVLTQVKKTTYERIVHPTSTTYYDTEGWCVSTSDARNLASPSRPIMLVKAKNRADWAAGNMVSRYAKAFLEIHFKTIEEINGTVVATPGNSNYYVTKLGRLELLGIPQITYEPLYCNSDQSKVVPGILKSSVVTTSVANPTQRAALLAHPNVHEYSTAPELMYTSATADLIIPRPPSAPNDVVSLIDGIGNYEKKFVYQTEIDHPAVFSSKDFTCCTPLGMTPKTGTVAGCCSGYGVNTNNKLICKLPIGTDLNVYFNRFVSNEGVGETLPGANGAVGLNDSGVEPDSDFIPETGEPKFRDSTSNKLYALGMAYCDRNRVVNGGVFGKFQPQPSTFSFPVDVNLPFSMVDSANDSASTAFNPENNRYLGKFGFDFGVRWNHHFYCSE